jgi:hypothetical protein
MIRVLSGKTGRSVCVLALAVLAMPAMLWGQTLGKGHRILLERGLQLQGFSTKDDVFHLSTLQAANYSAMCWSGESNVSLQGIAPGVPWARWASQSTMPPLGDEGPYMSQLVGIQLGDEWDLNNDAVRATAADWFNAVRDNYPNTIIYNNNWAGQVWDGNLSDWLQRAHPDMICFDGYPFQSDYATGQPTMPPGGSQASWMSELRRYRAYSVGYGIPYATYRQTFHAEEPWSARIYRDPSTTEMAFNTFGALVFNCKYLIDFWYNSGSSSLFTKPGGDSYPTALYYQLEEVNRQAKHLGPALVRLTSTNRLNANGASVDTMIIRGKHTTGPSTSDYNALPIGLDVDPQAQAVGDPGYSDWEYQRNDPYMSGWSVTNIGTKNNGLKGDVIIAWFKVLDEAFDGPATNEVYLMVVNGLTDMNGTPADCRQTITVDFSFGSSGITSLQKLSRDTGLVETVSLTPVSSKRRLTVDLDGGFGELYKFNTGAPFAGADATPPAAVSGLSAARGWAQATLHWTNPADVDFTRTMVRSKVGSGPANYADGTLILDQAAAPGSQGSYTDNGLTPGTTYYYAAFTRDGFMNYSPAATVSVTPTGVPDTDADSDVDQEDFGTLQRCLSGSGAFPSGCDAMDLNLDMRIDDADLGMFLGCMRGPGNPPGC